MALTPVEIRHMTPGRGLFGYKAAATDRLLEEIVDSFEDVWRERADLADRVEQLEGDLVRYRELETLLRSTLVSAERASAEVKEQARREAELILSEAHAEARAIQRQAVAENERLRTESVRLRAQLAAALETLTVEEPAAPPVPEPVTAEQAGEDEPADDVEVSWHGFAGGAALPDADAA
ncbi:MAG TPA: DivIVA domain-containing protein [Gaiellaceae bacterium]|nr:DivIVA domain-containing protein [Gaiellaceae bacterium]